MNRNLKYLQDIFFLLMMGFSLCAVQACSGDEKDEAMDEPSKNTTDIAVTGSVEEYGCSYAKISGYANLNLLPAGSGNPQIGIEICMAEKEDDEPEYEIIATSMSGNCFTVEFHPLNPEMKYKYRSFVEYADLTHYGEYKTFTTKNTSTLISTGGTTDVTFNSATISSTLHNLKEDFYKVGVLCSTSKSALHPDSINSWSVDEKAIYYELKENDYTVTFDNLKPATTYYYASFVYILKDYYLAEIKSFTTKGLSNLTTTGDVSDITTFTATVTSTVVQDAIDDKLNVGIAYANSETALHPDSVFLVEEFSKEDVAAGACSVTLKDLSPSTTYYYASFVEFNGKYSFEEIKSFTTKGFSNLITTGDVSDISISTATVISNVVTDAIDESLNVGIAYSTSEAALRPDGVFHVEEFSKEDVAAGVCSVTLKDLSPSTTYYYASFVEFNGKYSFEEIKSFTTKEYIPESVDLGLSVKWATCNVGASSPEGYGGYYAWGETEEKSDYTYETYKYWSDRDGDGYNDENEYQNIGSNISGTQYDVAHVKWGGNWRMPTKEEIIELGNKCSWKWTSLNGVNGQLVTGPNGNSIFLPAAGYCLGTYLHYSGSYGHYWSATSYEYFSYRAYYLDFHDGYHGWDYYHGRYQGRAVRPVTE